MAEPVHIIISPDDVPANLYSKISGMSKHDIISAIKSYKVPTTTPAELGQVGESFVEDILKKEYTIINTTKTGYKGDLIIKYKSLRILVEVKNYSSAVPISEITKFNRDLSSQIHAGVFISLGSTITGHPDFDFIAEYEKDSGAIPVLFLNTTHQQVVQKSVALLIKYAECVHTTGRLCPSIKHRLLELRNKTEEFYFLRTSIQSICESMTKQFNNVNNKLLATEASFVRDIDEIITVICDNDADSQVLLEVECDARDNMRRLFMAYASIHNERIQKVGRVITCGELVTTVYKQHFYLQWRDKTQKIDKASDVTQLEHELRSPSIANFSLEA